MRQKLPKPRIGGHLKAGQGLRTVCMAARALDYDILQIMLGGQLDWNPYNLTEEAAAEYHKLTYGMDTYVHLPFLINPCENSGRKKQFGRATIRKYAKVARNLNTKALILHPGFKKEMTEIEAFRNSIAFFEGFLGEDDIQILLETDAGSKNESAIGSLDFIEELLNELKDEKLAMCLDTCHLYARGINLWDKETREKVLNQYGTRTKLVHLNVPDPDVELGSHRDRHNSPFESFHLPSEDLVQEIVSHWPVILERRSIAVQKKDVEFIRKVVKTTTPRKEIERKGITGYEGERDDT